MLARAVMPCFGYDGSVSAAPQRLPTKSLPSSGRQYDHLPGRRLDSGPGVKQRNILAGGPKRRKIAIVAAEGVARLARRIDGAAGIPVADIEHHAERRAGGQHVVRAAIGSGMRDIGSATKHQWPDRELRRGRLVGE